MGRAFRPLAAVTSSATAMASPGPRASLVRTGSFLEPLAAEGVADQPGSPLAEPAAMKPHVRAALDRVRASCTFPNPRARAPACPRDPRSGRSSLSREELVLGFPRGR